MKTRTWLAGAVIAGGVVLAMHGCLTTAPPDERLAGRLDKLCAIARANIATPERGVRKVGGYLGEHAGDLLGELGDTFATIEKIPDDAKHDARARVARDRVRAPLRACEDDWDRFFAAVNADPAASALVERFGERFNRTLAIFLSGARADLRHFPRQLERLLD